MWLTQGERPSLHCGERLPNTMVWSSKSKKNTLWRKLGKPSSIMRSSRTFSVKYADSVYHWCELYINTPRVELDLCTHSSETHQTLKNSLGKFQLEENSQKHSWIYSLKLSRSSRLGKDTETYKAQSSLKRHSWGLHSGGACLQWQYLRGRGRGRARCL